MINEGWVMPKVLSHKELAYKLVPERAFEAMGLYPDAFLVAFSVAALLIEVGGGWENIEYAAVAAVVYILGRLADQTSTRRLCKYMEEHTYVPTGIQEQNHFLPVRPTVLDLDMPNTATGVDGAFCAASVLFPPLGFGMGAISCLAALNNECQLKRLRSLHEEIAHQKRRFCEQGLASRFTCE